MSPEACNSDSELGGDAGVVDTASGIVDTQSLLGDVLSACYKDAIVVVETGDSSSLDSILGQTLREKVARLAGLKHASRGALLTLMIYKAVFPEQDIRYSKAEFEGGFPARVYDTKVTVPFLMRESLPYNVETHWLSQTLSFAGPWTRELVMKTQPKAAGPLLVECVNDVEEWKPSGEDGAEDVADIAGAVATLVLVELIRERNKGKVALTRPKNLTIAQTKGLLSAHMRHSYSKTGAARLPQLAMYAVYQCMLESVLRYDGCVLEPLARMKSADRKAGSIGDVVISKSDIPVEAVETKFERQVDETTVRTAMDKIRTGTVDRYFILSTSGVKPEDSDAIVNLCREFRSSNGCEIIVNGVLETVGYYLRLIESTSEFLMRYVKLLEDDQDLDYEHRIAWNFVCKSHFGIAAPGERA